MVTQACYDGLQAIPQTKGPFTPKMQSPQMDIFMRLTADMDPEGRHLVINAIANQLRYPNIHTHFFSCVLLHLFLEAPSVLLLLLSCLSDDSCLPCSWVHTMQRAVPAFGLNMTLGKISKHLLICCLLLADRSRCTYMTAEM